MTALEKRIASIVAEDIEILENKKTLENTVILKNTIIYPIEDIKHESVQKKWEEERKAKKEKRQPAECPIPEDAIKGKLYICIIDISGQDRIACFVYDDKPDKPYVFKAADLSFRQVLNELSNIGVPYIDSHRLFIAVKYEEIKNAPKYIYAADKIDIMKIGRKWGIALNEFISKEKLSPYMFLGYIRAMTNGDREDYYRKINKWIEDKPKLQIFLALSIVGLISRIIGKDDERIILLACGGSSSGKSTASLLPASAWCNYKYTVHKYRSTSVGLQDTMQELNFIPIVADEFFTNKDSDGKRLSGEIFSFYGSSGKTKYGSKEPESNTVPLITSSEISLTELIHKANTKSSGEFGRYIEIKVELGDLTSDGEQAREIKQFLKKNYGWLGFDVASYLVNNDYISKDSDKAEELQDKFDELIEYLVDEYEGFKGEKAHQIEERLLEKIALLICSAEIINKAAEHKLKIDIEKMQYTLFASIKEQCNWGKISQEYILKLIKQFYMDNQVDFCDYENSEEKKSFDEDKHMGLYSKKKNYIWLHQNALDKIPNVDWVAALSVLRNVGSLIVGKNDKHLSKQVMTDGVHRYRFYEINTDMYEGDDFWCHREKEKATSCH